MCCGVLEESVESRSSSMLIYHTSAHTASSIRYLEPEHIHVQTPVLHAVIETIDGDAA